jgi:hypothetical protein
VSAGLIVAGGILWWRGLRGSAPIPPAAPVTLGSAPSS